MIFQDYDIFGNVSFSCSPFSTDANQLFLEVSFLGQIELSDFEEVWNHEESEYNLAEEDIDEHNVDEVELPSEHEKLDEDYQGQHEAAVANISQTCQHLHHIYHYWYFIS